MTMQLPLPGLPGLTSVRVPHDVAVRDLVKKLKELDSRVAGCTPAGDVAGRGLLISFGGRPHIRVVDETRGFAGRDKAVPRPELYDKLKSEVAKAGHRTLRREQLDALCEQVWEDGIEGGVQAAGLDSTIAEGWLDALIDDGMVFAADKGRVIILNPSGPGVSEDIANALRRDHEVVGAKVSRLQDKLKRMYDEERKMQEAKDKLIAKASRNITLKKTAVLAFMTAQFGVLAYYVYEVYSWDVMEPATYFLMLSYSVGSSLYFAANKREASYNNLMDEALKKREAKLKPLHGYSRSRHAKLEQEIKRFQEAVALLSSHRDAHSPLNPP